MIKTPALCLALCVATLLSIYVGRADAPKPFEGVVHDVPFTIGNLDYRCEVRLHHQHVTLIRCNDPKVAGP